MKKISLLLALFLVHCSLFIVKAQNPEYKFRKLSIKDGLSHNNVYTIIQDKSGYLWFGTQDGLNKYDGSKITIYRHDINDTNSLSTGNFGKIYQDRSGIFWFGTFGGGLDRFDPKTNTFTNFSHQHGLSNNQIMFVFEDSYNHIWVGTANGGLNKFNRDSEKFTVYKPDLNDPSSHSSIRAKCICETKDTTLWIGTGNGLNKFNKDNNNFTCYLHDPNNLNSPSSNSIQHLFADDDGTIWISYKETGISKFDPKTETFKHYKHNANDLNSISDNNVEYILRDSYGIFWIGTYSRGLNRFDPKTERFTHFKHDLGNSESISHNRVEYLFEDASRNLWIATRGGGLNILDLKPQKFFNIIHNPKDKNSLPHPAVMAIDSDEKGNLWIGTDGGGLSKYNPITKNFNHFKQNPIDNNSLSANRVWSVLVDKNGIIWVGTYMGGLNRIEYRNGTYNFTRYLPTENNDSSISNNIINTIIEDEAGTIWIATAYGLNKLVKKGTPNDYIFEKYYHNTKKSQQFIDNYISDIFLDSNGRLWVGSYAGGLFLFKPDTGEFINYNPSKIKDSVFKRDIHVSILFEDLNENLWIGTESNGLIKFDYNNMNFVAHPKNNELLSNMIVGILEDDLGNLWISTSRSLSKYSAGDNKLINYTFIEGIESSGFSRNAVFKSDDGIMYFGSNQALTYFNPLEVIGNPYLPKVNITDFKILNKSVWDSYVSPYLYFNANYKQIVLTKKDYFFTIEFAALDYTSPKQNQYKYMLEGLDEDWIDVQNMKSATFTNLNPGTYTFKVKGSNNDKVWNETSTELKIKIIPPFYKSWWFITIIIITIILLIALYIKIREKNLIKEKEYLEEKVKERTNEILTQKDDIEEKSIKLEQQKEKIIKSYHNVQLLSQIGQQIIANLSVEKILKTTYENVNDLIETPIFSIGIHNPEKESIDFFGLERLDGDILKSSDLLENKNLLSVWCFENQKEILLNNYSKEYKKYVSDKLFYKKNAIHESLIYLPLTTTKKIGVITIQNPKINAFTDYHLNILKNIAVYTSIALENADAFHCIELQKEEISSQAEELQTANDKLIELDQFKEELTGMIIHDLKNPLNAIIGLAESDIVKQSGKQMLNMIMNILDVNKFENTEIKIQTSNTSIYELSKLALSQVDLLYHQKSIKLINRIQNYYVDIDPEIIERVFINLLTNAIKYTPNNGTITLDSEEYSPDFIRIKVTDTGQGIPKEKLHTVFGKFEQVIARKSGLGRSTGIGLTFCKLFVEAHGGEINVESEENEGSIFWFTLPLGYQGDEEITIEEEVIEEKAIELTSTEKEILKPFLLKLQELEVYESTEVEKIIEQLDCSKTENLQKWKAEIVNAIDALNEEKYKKLIHLID
ncbi:MAG: GAF domain-containing protein [Bacteroidales bacterium]|nr:GAF domain-containing protein [Bacteroidales bacterium]